MRPLVIEYPEDKNCQDKIYEYLFEELLLIAPVVYEGVKTRDVYLPPGEWIDFWKEARYHGSQTIAYPTPVDIIPVFIKSGAILPMILNADYMIGGSITNFSQLVFNIYPSGVSSYEWYDDSNQTTRTIECINGFVELISKVLSNQNLMKLLIFSSFGEACIYGAMTNSYL